MQIVLDSIGGSIWQMALEPCLVSELPEKNDSGYLENGSATRSCNKGSCSSSDEDNSEIDSEDDSMDIHPKVASKHSRLAVACDNGVQIYNVSITDKLTYYRSLPRVSGETATLVKTTEFSTFYRCKVNEISFLL